ncbi:MAG TPA: type II toxin-antitoxin system VapB family antitoxin [Thermoanaerobaculia bacterium]|nr:type II toxin-antitoxin system VapB family antitoxin [Thermoanaerobaculia bacterium]
METAKVFWSGRSQAVRLPKQFRMEAREVRIKRRGKEIILEPLPDTWSWLDAIAGTLDEDFVEAVQEKPQATERPDLEKLFRS